MVARPMDEEELFDGHPDARALHRAVKAAIEKIGAAETRATRSQAGFHRRHPFAATWRPGKYLKGAVAPLVLTVYLRRRDDSPRWKEVVETKPGRFTHHVELRSADDVDDGLRRCLEEAWREAG